MNKMRNIFITIFFILAFLSLASADETLTITTYYPSPYGSYNQLTTTGSTYLATTSGNNVGIGTTAPLDKLDVNGNALIGINTVKMSIGLSGSEYPSVGYNVAYTGTSNSYKYRVNDTASMVRFYTGKVETFTAASGIGGNAITFTTGPYVAQGGITWTNGSDIRLKTNIKNLPVLDKLKYYRAVSFDWRQTGKHDVGTIAQELYKVFPEAVVKGSDGTDPILSTDPGAWGVSYEKLGPIALQGVKEITQRINLSSAPEATPSMMIDLTGNVGIGTTNPRTKFAVSGLTATAGTTVVVDASGNFYTASSSSRYKDNIKDLKIDYEKIFKVKPKSFTYKTTGEKDIGYLAEDFEKLGLKDLLIYNNKRQPESIKYDKITAYLIEIVKNQQGEINRLSQEIDKLKKH